jgi:hypothetical protein
VEKSLISAEQTPTTAVWQRDIVVAAAAVLIVLMSTLPGLMTGWFPQDEGQIGQAAERFLQGQLPHRDFDDMYTGLLTVLHAMAFKLLGVRTESTRWMLLAASLPFLICVYRISRRWLRPLDAGGLVVLCGIWSVRLNPESMPSWYILFLTVGMLDALLTFLERPHLRWLFWAGLLAGVAVLFKITGIYLIAAGVLILMDCEQRQSASSAPRSATFSVWILFCILVYFLAASRLWSAGDPLLSALHLTIPAFGLGISVLVGEWQRGRGAFWQRAGTWLRLQLVFAAGAFLPLSAWLLWYWQAGALSELYEGLIVLPQRRLQHAGAAFPGPAAFLLSGAAFTAVCLAGSTNGRSATAAKDSRFLPRLAVAILGLLLVCGHLSIQGRLACFQAVRSVAPYVSALLLLQAIRCCGADSGRAFAIAATLIMGAQVQFPFAMDLYFPYVAPLVFIGGSFGLQATDAARRHAETRVRWSRVFIAGLSLFAWLQLKSVVPLGNVSSAPTHLSGMQLRFARCGLQVERSLGEAYERLVTEIHARTDDGEAILAGPDCPEVYFLAERQNPTRLFYDFFRPELLSTAEDLNALADAAGIRLVVVKQPFLRDFTKAADQLENWARQRFGNPLVIGFGGNSDSSAPALFNVYSDSSGNKTNELPGTK